MSNPEVLILAQYHRRSEEDQLLRCASEAEAKEIMRQLMDNDQVKCITTYNLASILIRSTKWDKVKGD